MNFNPRTILHAGEFLTLLREGHWEYTQRTNATGAAIIVAVTDERKLLLVEQYRIPIHSRTIELPETGYDAGQMEVLTHGPASSGLTSEKVTLFRATQLQRTGEGGGVAHEQITVHEVPLEGIDNWLGARARTGMLIDPKVYAGLYFIEKLAG